MEEPTGRRSGSFYPSSPSSRQLLEPFAPSER
eukprot:CAMPEP_0113326714 /NCGR_PEP_ID=MMETSP0010_2-20120614/18730_1 /TAXON_ID=216773 ORGANISM="Corethron hystrix, Strain 308" /NCGR_SAMPLE_ID=MMETSP0010_2 /ASSEMBLY_ACC=CAM_ASM_000155 /LENGTH=31 /DNA_ID=CAMNT_0000187187 /DNA_START=371 /DNA_END=466 /DNA_ORIENTATION=+ /assembly_acc=CAM_ASM_000155